MTKKCLKAHGAKLHSPSASALYFFKIMIGPFRSTLFIPPKAALILQNLVNRNARLEDSNGQYWIVKVSIVENSMAFQQGWDQFVSDHSIKHGELVVFKYVGGSDFSLQIFGLSGCERLYAPKRIQENILQRKRKKSATPCDHLSLSQTCIDATDRLSEKVHGVVTVSTSIGMEEDQTKHPNVKNNQIKPSIDHLEPMDIISNNDLVKRPKAMETGILPVDSRLCETIDAKFVAEDIGNLTLADGKQPQGAENEQRCNVAAMEECSASREEFRKKIDSNLTASSSQGCTFDPQELNQNRSMENFGKDYTKNSFKESEKVAHAKEQYTIICKTATAIACPEDNMEIPASVGWDGCRFLITEKGTCIIVEGDSVIEPDPRSMIPIDVDDHDVDVSRRDVTRSETENVILTSELVPNSPMVETNNICDATDSSTKHGELGSLGNNSNAMSKMQTVLYVENAPPRTDKMLECDKKSKIEGGNSPLGSHPNEMSKIENIPCVENAPQSMDTMHENYENIDAAGVDFPIDVSKVKREQMNLKDKVPAVVKLESVDSALLSSPDLVKFSFSVTTNAQHWHELPDPLPLKRKKNERKTGERNERKVMFLRDSFMRVWPVLYHESFRFTGFLGGWFSFASANNVQVGDDCLLEMTSEPENMFNVQVSRK